MAIDTANKRSATVSFLKPGCAVGVIPNNLSLDIVYLVAWSYGVAIGASNPKILRTGIGIVRGVVRSVGIVSGIRKRGPR